MDIVVGLVGFDVDVVIEFSTSGFRFYFEFCFESDH